MDNYEEQLWLPMDYTQKDNVIRNYGDMVRVEGVRLQKREELWRNYEAF